MFDLFVLKTSVLTPFPIGANELPALTPIYAAWLPNVSPRALWFVAAACAFVASAARLARPERTPHALFVVVLALAAVALPVALFALRSGTLELGSKLAIYPNEEVYFDALGIREYRPFLANYVELMPGLSLHGRHFPPGHASLLYAVGLLFGRGVLPAGITVLACFAASLVFVNLALARSTDALRARQGVLLLLAAPSLVNFACTSMDAVFLLFASVAWWAAAGVGASLGDAEGSTRATRVGRPLFTGLALAIATLFSFSAIPVGLALGLAIAIAGRHAMLRALAALAWVAAGYAASVLLLYAATGFALWACLVEAQRSNVEFMTAVMGRSAREMYGFVTYGNGAAFLIGAGVGLVSAAVAGAAPRKSAWSAAFLLTLGVMTFGGIYFMETERIWLYAMPWLAAIAVADRPFSDGSLRLLLAVGCVQTLAMETFLFTLW